VGTGGRGNREYRGHRRKAVDGRITGMAGSGVCPPATRRCLVELTLPARPLQSTLRYSAAGPKCHGRAHRAEFATRKSGRTNQTMHQAEDAELTACL
jgi:hypothetical protein